MLTSKQRAYLKSLSNNLPVTTIIGKDGITESVINSIKESFNTKELIKITLLENSALSSKDIINELAQKVNAESVQYIGRKVVLYKKFKENPVIILPKK